jgi:hypothetical protein
MAERDGENEAATGAPGTVELSGQTYLVGQPTDQDFATLRNHLRKSLQNPFQAIAEDLKYLPPEYRAVAIEAATKLKAGGGVELTEAYIRERLMEPAGAAFLTWLLIRKNHPDVTLEQLRTHFTEATTQDILAKLYEASGLGVVASGKGIGRAG